MKGGQSLRTGQRVSHIHEYRQKGDTKTVQTPRSIGGYQRWEGAYTQACMKEYPPHVYLVKRPRVKIHFRHMGVLIPLLKYVRGRTTRLWQFHQEGNVQHQQRGLE